MNVIVTFDQQTYVVDFAQPIDISLPLQGNESNPMAWYLPPPTIQPVVVGDWIGKVSEGSSSTNFNTICFNPHADGTHTECLGHITEAFYDVNETLKQFVFFAQLVSVTPELQDNGDAVITLKQLKTLWIAKGQQAFIIRTYPNSKAKKHTNYSHTNPPYLDPEAAAFLRKQGIKHLLIDLPSVDKEKDEGKLLAHKAFIYVAEDIVDDFYLLNLQIASFVNDASPSKPILYRLNR